MKINDIFLSKGKYDVARKFTILWINTRNNMTTGLCFLTDTQA